MTKEPRPAESLLSEPLLIRMNLNFPGRPSNVLWGMTVTSLLGHEHLNDENERQECRTYPAVASP